MADDQIIAAAHEERFSRKKHDADFPTRAVQYCLEAAGISIKDVDRLVFHEKPLATFERIMSEQLTVAPRALTRFQRSAKSWLGQKLWMPSLIRKETGYRGKILFASHHRSHAASTYFSSPFEEATILTIDGVGEMETVTIGRGHGQEITPIEHLEYPHSLGLLYSTFTQYCGFKVNSGEYKLMGLAPYGTAKYADLILNNVVDIRDDGSFELDLSYFGFRTGWRMTSRKLEQLLGAPCRQPETEMTAHYKDVAASIQLVAEQIILGLVKRAIECTGIPNICLGGGVALNCVANAKVRALPEVQDLYVFPNPGDAGASLGAAFLGWLDSGGELRHTLTTSKSMYLGPSWSSESAAKILTSQGIQFTTLKAADLSEFVAQQLTDKAVVGWFQGRMEFGPRALGNRSILASPVHPDMQKHLNLRIKKREGFRPFAPVVIEDQAQNWFELDGKRPFMTETCRCLQPDRIPSCAHLDHSSRVQTLGEEDNSPLYKVLEAHHRLTDVPVLINTSFNLRGEPIVCTPQDALRTFFNCDMDHLVIENHVITKTENTSLASNFKVQHHALD